MSMLQLDFHLPEFGNLVKDLGLEEGGRAQQHLVKNVARRITKYVPKRTYSSIENAIAQGQEPANGRIVIPGELPEQYKGEKREKDYVVQGERMGEVTDTQSKRELIADKPLTVKNLVHCAFGGLPHCEVTTE